MTKIERIKKTIETKYPFIEVEYFEEFEEDGLKAINLKNKKSGCIAQFNSDYYDLSKLTASIILRKLVRNGGIFNY